MLRLRSILLACAVAALCLLVTPVTATKEYKCTQEDFSSFKSLHSKVYASEVEEAMRFQHFCASVARAYAKEQKHGTNGVFGITQFADLAEEEFKEKYLSGFQPQSAATLIAGAAPLRKSASLDLELPASVDWREQGMVTQVKNQGQCGSCWAFSAIETIESAFMQTHPNYRVAAAQDDWGLSVQEVLDCTDYYIFGACHGAWAALAYDLVQKQGVVNDTVDPYTGTPVACTPEKAEPVTFVSSYSYATPGCVFDCSNQNMTAIQSTVATYGPLSICLDAKSFQDYTGGILPASSCSDSLFDSDHCIQLVGYNVTSDPSQSYWLARNSWGTSWGIAGYIHMEMGDGVNTCGMGNMATIVELVPDEEMMDRRAESEVQFS